MHRLTLFAALLALIVALPADAQRRKKKATRSTKIALLVLLENGGIETAVAECTKGLRLPKTIPVARCGKRIICLRNGETPVSLLRRITSLLVHYPQCRDPRNWKVTRVKIDTFIKQTSDWMLEEITTSLQSAEGVKKKYHKVEVLQDAKCTAKTALASLRALAKSGYQIDVHVLTHGGKDKIIGHKHQLLTPENFFTPAKAIRGLKLRAVYQMNCVSGTLVDEWQALGAKAISHCQGEKNNYTPQGYFIFLKRWLDGEKFGTAVSSAYADTKTICAKLYEMGGKKQYITDSVKFTTGNSKLVIGGKKVATSNPVTKTAMMLADEYKKAKKSLLEAAKALIKAGHSVAKTAEALAAKYKCTPAQLAVALKGAGCSINNIALALKNQMKCGARQVAQCLFAAGYNAGQIALCLKQKLNCTVAQIASHLKRAGCSINDIALALKNKLGCSVRQVADYLIKAGFSVGQVAKALKNKLSCSSEDVAKHLKAVGCSIGNIALALKNDLGLNLRQVAGRLRSAGCTTAQIAIALKTKLGCTTTKVAELLKYVGCSTKHIALTLKNDLGCTARQVASRLKSAGCTAKQIAKALKKDLKCSTENVAKHMQKVGFSLSQTAQAMWNYVTKKNASALNSLAGALVKAFNKSAVFVAGELAKLGIKAK